jgi:hypothetical protein
VLILSATTAIPPDRTGPGAPGPGRQKRELAFSEAERPLSLSYTEGRERGGSAEEYLWIAKLII